MIRTPSHLLHICHATIKTAGSPALRKPFFGFLCACRLSFCHRIWRALGTSRAQRPRGPAIIQHSLGLRWCQVGVDSIETFSIVDGKAIPRRLQSRPRRCVPPHLEADSELTDRFVAARLQTATVRSPPGCQPPCRRAVLSNDVDRRARAGELPLESLSAPGLLGMHAMAIVTVHAPTPSDSEMTHAFSTLPNQCCSTVGS